MSGGCARARWPCYSYSETVENLTANFIFVIVYLQILVPLVLADLNSLDNGQADLENEVDTVNESHPLMEENDKWEGLKIVFSSALVNMYSFLVAFTLVSQT